MKGRNEKADGGPLNDQFLELGKDKHVINQKGMTRKEQGNKADQVT